MLWGGWRAPTVTPGLGEPAPRVEVGALARLPTVYVLFTVAMFAVSLIALVDIVSRDDSQVRGLPKLVWVLLVVFVPLLGSALWFIVGHDWSAARAAGSFGGRSSENVSFGDPRRSERVGFGGSRRASSWSSQPTAARQKTTEEQLADLDREIEFHEQQARLRALEVEVEKRKRLE
jgi:hypothetical protein